MNAQRETTRNAILESQKSRRAELLGLLGDLPAFDRPLSAQLIGRETRPGYELETLLLDLNGFEPVPAYFIKPLGATEPLPCVLYSHAHGGEYHIGKEEFVCGRGGIQNPPYAEALARRGFCGLCIDTWCFGERRNLSESERFKLMLWNGQVLWGMMIYDNLRALDFLQTREDVDGARLGALGLSMGSTLSWWTAALDERVKVCVDICCLTEYQALIETRGLDGHGLYYYVPRLLKHFSAAAINALVAPRPHLSLAGNYDGLTPPQGLERIDAELKQAYAALDASNAWELRRFETGHFETAQMRALSLDFLGKWL